MNKTLIGIIVFVLLIDILNQILGKWSPTAKAVVPHTRLR